MTLDADTLALLRPSLQHVLTTDADAPLDARLAELGWDDVLDEDASSALRILFEIKGDTLASADALGPRLGRRLAEITGDDALAASCVTLPSPFGASVVVGAMLVVDAVATSAIGDRSVVVAVGDRLAVCPAGTLAATALGGTDDTLGLVHVVGSVPSADVAWVDGDASAQVTAQGRWLLACELVGIARHVVASAVDYTKVRVQYGKPIGVFQALQHRLASAHALVVGAGHLATEAGNAGDAWSATVAKCLAGRAAEHACTQAQQCFGAIGFTWEHELHRYLRRTYVLDQLLGDWRTLEHEIGEALQRSGTVPHIGSL